MLHFIFLHASANYVQNIIRQRPLKLQRLPNRRCHRPRELDDGGLAFGQAVEVTHGIKDPRKLNATSNQRATDVGRRDDRYMEIRFGVSKALSTRGPGPRTEHLRSQ